MARMLAGDPLFDDEYNLGGQDRHPGDNPENGVTGHTLAGYGATPDGRMGYFYEASPVPDGSPPMTVDGGGTPDSDTFFCLTDETSQAAAALVVANEMARSER